jgi:hypothetical protein
LDQQPRNHRIDSGDLKYLASLDFPQERHAGP